MTRNNFYQSINLLIELLESKILLTQLDLVFHDQNHKKFKGS